MTENKNISKNCGRPQGRKKTAKIEISIEPDVKHEFMEILSSEGRNASTEICRWIRDYIKKNREHKN